jgi:glutamyl-tRNA synthetase
MKNKSTEIKNIRTRIAPSPTGYPHIGNMRAFLFPYLAAKHYGGSFILRIEDTDKKRQVEGGVEKLIEVMRAYKMDPDEGPTFGGDYGPYIQSERKDLYKKHAEELVEKGAAYYCFCTEERLTKMREEQKANGLTQTKYDGLCRKIDPTEAKKRAKGGEDYVVRLKVPTTGVCEFRDFAFGKVQVPFKSIDDQVLLKSDGLPTYHFGVVVDDHLMKITHVFRGEEYLSSTPKDILMYEAFGWEIPQWVHMPMVVGDNGKKFGKRSGALPALEYLEAGYLIDAILNYIALLGWNPGDNTTMMTREELVEKFTLEKMQKSPARFDMEKFTWLNGEHIRALDIEVLTEQFLEWLKTYGDNPSLYEFLSNDEFLSAKVALVQERAKTFVEIVEQIRVHS